MVNRLYPPCRLQSESVDSLRSTVPSSRSILAVGRRSQSSRAREVSPDDHGHVWGTSGASSLCRETKALDDEIMWLKRIKNHPGNSFIGNNDPPIDELHDFSEG